MSTPAQKWAILIGVSRYPLISAAELLGPDNDIRGYKSLLEERFGFLSAHIVVLLNEAATRQAILEAITSLGERVLSDDIVVIAYSGHGSQRLEIPSAAAPVLWGAAVGKEADRLQETLVPYDSGRGNHPSRDITDSELHALLARLTTRTANVTVILDCCHCAGALRDAFGNRARGLPADRRPLPSPPGADNSRSGMPPPELPPEPGTASPRKALPYALLAACRSDEKAYELTITGGATATTYGAFSYFLQRELLRCAAGTAVREVLARASVEVNRQRSQQHPQGQGHLDAEIFGVQELPPRRGVRVQERAGGTVTLSAGLIHGVTVGSRYAIAAVDAAPTLLSVTQVDAATAQAMIVAEADPQICAVGAYAAEVTHAPGPQRLSVELSAPPGESAAAALRTSLLRVPQVTLVDATTAAESTSAARICLLPARSAARSQELVPQLGALSRPTWAVIDGDGELVLPPLPADAAGSAEVLAQNLKKLACLRAVEGCDNPDPSSALYDRFAVQLLRETADGGWAPAAEILGEGVCFESEDRFAIAIKSRAAIPVYVAILDLGVTGRISLLYPYGDSEPECLAPGSSFVLGTQAMEEQRIFLPEQSLWIRPASPVGSGASHEVIGHTTMLFFFSAMPVDFSSVEQPGFSRQIRRLAAPLRLLGMALTADSRDFDLEPDALNKDWTVVRKRLRIHAVRDSGSV